MRKPFSLVVILWLLMSQMSVFSSYPELTAIRRVYMEELGVPPSVKEIEWLITYETNTYQSAVEHVLNFKYGKEQSEYKSKLTRDYLSLDPETLELKYLFAEQKDTIIKYQSGNMLLSVEEAKKALIKQALTVEEDQQDPIDYLFLCLCGKATNTTEINLYTKILRNASGTDDEKLREVLEAIMQSNSFLMY